ncbi:hypothetical protein T4B_6771, partial [Trichinella pseudospiralis]
LKIGATQLLSHHQSSTERITRHKYHSSENNGFIPWIKYQSLLHYIMNSHICIINTSTEIPIGADP